MSKPRSMSESRTPNHWAIPIFSHATLTKTPNFHSIYIPMALIKRNFIIF